MVTAVARLQWSVHRKLFAGFLAGAVLLVALGALSVVVINAMNERMQDVEQHQKKADLAQRMLYQVTAQSHYRAMALLIQHHPEELTNLDPDLKRPDEYLRKLEASKKTFHELLTEIRTVDPSDRGLFAKIDRANQEFDRAGRKVSALYERSTGAVSPRAAREAVDDATVEHINGEHVASHAVEDLLEPLVEQANRDITRAQARFESSRSLLIGLVVAFSAVSVLMAMSLGYLLSWAFILPVRRVQGALAQLSEGRFPDRVDVPNRDEFGALAHDLNRTGARVHDSLEEQRRLAGELRQTNASLVHASEAKSRFLASVSHELRTPLNAILGFTEALLAGVDGPLNDDQHRSLTWVQRGGRDLLGLINEILDLSRIEAGKLVLEPEPFDPGELVESVVAQHRSLAAHKDVRLTWEAEGGPQQLITQDPQRVRQILVNLLGNAVKFTDTGEVALRILGDDALWHVVVEDTGPGIPLEEREAIFREFQQAHGSERGTGLGLTISRRLARAMGGEVWCESELGVGSRFHLTLPRDFSSLPDHGPGRGAESAAGEMSVGPGR